MISGCVVFIVLIENMEFYNEIYRRKTGTGDN